MNANISRQMPAGINPEHFRNVLSHWPTGVSIVSTLDDDSTPIGLVIGSFSSISLTPPLVAFSLMKTASSLDVIRRHGAFCVNVLSKEQASLVEPFCKGNPRQRFDQTEYTFSKNGLPRIEGSLAWIDARLEAEYEGGDHSILIGHVAALEEGASGAPLIFSQGRFGFCEHLC